MVYMYHSFLVHSSADGHLGCFHVLAMTNSAACGQILYHLSQVQCLMQKEQHTDGIVEDHTYPSVLSHSLLFACLFYSLTHPFIYLLLARKFPMTSRILPEIFQKPHLHFQAIQLLVWAKLLGNNYCLEGKNFSFFLYSKKKQRKSHFENMRFQKKKFEQIPINNL